MKKVAVDSSGLLSLKLSIFIFLFLSTSATADCPTECYCSDVALTTTCIGERHLNYFPELNFTLLSIGQMKRLEIRDYVLSSLIISQKESQIFFHLVSELILSHNQITNFYPDEESENENLQNFDESQSLYPLRHLDLSVNNLTVFDSCREMNNLRVLDLSHNSIRSINLKNLGKLESLNLRSNSIEELKEDAFESLKSLHYINLDSNRLKELGENLFSNLPLLAHLIISSNPLQFPPGFLFNSRTQFIDLSNVGLRTIVGTLETTVRDLRLNNNNLNSVKVTDFECYPNLGLLVLDDNQIEIIEDDAFGRMDFLTGLWINSNRLTKIPGNLPSSLKSLQLEENSIKTLNISDFSTLPNLETLNLHGNGLSILPPFIFSQLTSLRTLNLRSNSIDSIFSTSFKNLTNLETLDLSQNPIKVIVNGAFSPLINLNVLHLSRLGEKNPEFDTAFNSLSKILILDLSDSPNLAQKLINEGKLSYLKELKELYVERCEIRDVGNLCEQLLGLENIKTIRGRGNYFSDTKNNAKNISVPTLVSTFSLARLCPIENSTDFSRNKIEVKNQVPLNFTISQINPTLPPTISPKSSTTSISSTKITTPFLPKNSSFSPILNETVSTGDIVENSRIVPTSSYFEEPYVSRPNVSTNEEMMRGGKKIKKFETKTEKNEEIDEKKRKEMGSIDGFPPHSPTTSSPHIENFAKGSFHRLPQRLLLQSGSKSVKNDQNNGGSVIVKTVLISGATCMLSVLVLILLGLTLFRIHGGKLKLLKMRRNQNVIAPIIEKGNSYKRLEEKQEVELGISNRMYYENGQVYHIS